MPSRPLPEHVEWIDRVLTTLKVGGTWAIPRSGVVFRKTGERRIEWVETIRPCLLGDAYVDPDVDYAGVKEHAEAAGYTVVDAREAGTGRRKETDARDA